MENTKFDSSEPTETLEISDCHQFLRNFSTSSGSRKFFMGDIIMPKLFKSLPYIRALQRTSNHTRDVLNFYSRDDSSVFEKSKFSEDTTTLSDKPVCVQNY